MLSVKALASSQTQDDCSLHYSNSMPLGRPLVNIGFRVVDENNQDVMPFMPGELIVTGAGVGAGYLNASEKEQQRFTRMNIGGQDVPAFYTRDKVRLLPDGCIEFLGRADDQVKLRGYRVELEAIRHHIVQHASVNQASVGLYQPEKSQAEPRLVAWYVDNQASVGDANQGLEKSLNAHLTEHLPEYMIPTQWIKLPRLPLTLNGKVDTKSLPNPDELLAKSKAWQPPESEYEKQLADVWADLLNLERCGLNDNFFELGGNSLLATQVVARLRKLTGKEIAIADLFNHPQLKDQAACLQALASNDSSVNKVASTLKSVDPRQSHPLSFAQQRLWFLDQLNPHSAFYNVPAAIRFKGQIDEERIVKALCAVWDCHDGLRTRINLETEHKGTEVHKNEAYEASPQQTISNTPLSIQQTDLRELMAYSEEACKKEAAKLCRQEAQTPFNLHQDALMRTHLIRIANDELLLLVTLHHIISDAWSTDLLLQEFSRSYLGETLIRPDFNSIDFSSWEQQFFTAKREQKEVAFWQRALLGAEQYLPLPLDRERPEYQSWRGARLHRHINKQSIQTLDSLAQSDRYSRFMLLMTAFHLMLNQHTGANDISVTVPVAGRNPNGIDEGSIERTIGLFLNSLIVRSQFNDALTIRQLATQIREYLLTAFENQSLPFERLIRRLPITRATSYTPFNQVCFNLLNTPLGKSLNALNSDELQAELEISDACTAKYDMEWILVEQGDAIDLYVEYNADLFDAQSIDLMVDTFNEWLVRLPLCFDHCWAEPGTALEVEQANALLQRHKALTHIATPNFSVRSPDATEAALAAKQNWQLNAEQSNWLNSYCAQNNLLARDWLGSLAALSVSCYLEGSDDYVLMHGEQVLWVPAEHLQQDEAVTETIKQICIQAQTAAQTTLPISIAQNKTLGKSTLPTLHIHSDVARVKGHTTDAATHHRPQLHIRHTNEQCQLGLLDHEHRLPGLLSVMHTLLIQLMANTQLTMHRVAWLTPAQTKAVNDQLAGKKPAPIDNISNPLLDVLEQGLAINPDAIAVRDGESEITYQALHNMANKLARHLIQQSSLNQQASRNQKSANQEPRHTVALLIQPGQRWVTLMLAVIKAGYMYLPLDCKLPQDRIVRILEDADCDYLWFDSSYQKRIEDLQEVLSKRTAKVTMQSWSELLMSSAEQEVAPLSLEELSRTSSSEQVSFADKALYAIYTSGSTGDPKGAMVNHANARNLLDWYVSQYAISAQDKCLIMSSLAFDLTQKNIFASLSVGAQIVFPAMQQFDADVILETLQQQQISLLNCAPSAFYSIFSLCEDHTETPFINNTQANRFNALNSLRYLLLGGESIDVARLRPWLAHNDCTTRLVNMYGPTECTDIACAYTVSQEDLNAKHIELPIGYANDGVQLYVLDDQQRLLPPGIVGELAISGLSVGNGYINRPKLTANAFIPNPNIQNAESDVEHNNHKTLYRTGDRAYVDERGALVFSGRRDHQVKHRGFRIELNGIRSAILQLEKVAQVAVLLIPDARQQAKLVAVIQPFDSEMARQDEHHHLIDRLKALLEKRLPSYMLPERWLVQQDMPLNRNGKLDLTALATVIGNQSTRQLNNKEGQLPQTEREIWLGQLWQALLEVEHVVIEDDFFHIGGHSLLATQLISRMRKEAGIDIPLTVVFEHSCLGAMAAEVDRLSLQRLEGVATLDTYSIPLENLSASASAETRYPLSYAQQRLWFVHNLKPKSSDYNMSSVLKVSGPVDAVALDQACRALMQRHATLRTYFTQDSSSENGAYQQIAQTPKHFLTTHSLADGLTSEGGITAEADALIKHVTDTPFDLTQPPMWRASLITDRDDLHLLVITLHHIAADGWSMALLIRELLFFYQQAEGERTGIQADTIRELPALPIQYVDYASWQRQNLQGQRLQTLTDYWKQQLAGAPAVTPLQTDRPRTSNVDSVGARLRCQIPQPLSQELHTLAQQHSVTPYMLLMTAFNVVMHANSKQSDLVIGTDLANRNRQELENLIGFFVNVLPIRLKLNGNPSFSQLLQRVKGATLGAYTHQDLPFDKLVEVLNPQRNSLYHPIFQVLFVLQNAPTERLNKGGVNIEIMAKKQEQLRFDLALLLEETVLEESGPEEITTEKESIQNGTAGAINGHWSYSTALFDESTIQALNQSLLDVLQKVVQDSSLPLNQLFKQPSGGASKRRQTRQGRIGSLKGRANERSLGSSTETG